MSFKNPGAQALSPLLPWEAEHHCFQNLAPPNVFKDNSHEPQNSGLSRSQRLSLANVILYHPWQKLMGGDQAPGSLLSSGTGIDIPVLLLLIDGDEKMLKV